MFERPAAITETSPAAARPTAAASEELTLLARKIEYGFSTARQDNAELRKMIDEIGGVVKMLRNDMDSLRMTIQQHSRPATAAHHEAPANVSRPSSSTGAPQYRKSEADEAYERESGQPAHDNSEGMPQVQQARGFAKKEDKGDQVDISKVFYYGKK